MLRIASADDELFGMLLEIFVVEDEVGDEMA